MWRARLSSIRPTLRITSRKRPLPSPTSTRLSVLASQAANTPYPLFPETAIEQHLDNTWGDTGKALFNNWLGLVYQLTALDRKRPLLPGINPHNPLGLRK